MTLGFLRFVALLAFSISKILSHTQFQEFHGKVWRETLFYIEQHSTCSKPQHTKHTADHHNVAHAVLCTTAQYSTVRHGAEYHNTTQYNATQHDTAQPNTVKHGMTQHNTTQHGAT